MSRPRRARLLAGATAAAVLAPLTLLAPSAPAAMAAAESASLSVGAGMYDITGAVAETGAFGYAAQQEMTGLHTRLWSHAYVIGDEGGSRLAIVSADLGAIFPSIKVGVVRQLRARFGDRYTDANVMLTATHTHVGNSGHAHEMLYQIAGNDGRGYGFDQRNLDAVISGIVESIARADANLAPGTVALATGDLTGATRNRSIPAYDANSDAASFPNVNTTMTQLNLRAADGTPVGALNWFAVHPTLFSNKSTLISGDSKGFAQYTFGQRMGQDPSQARTFVAAFANSDLGDVVSSRGNSFSAPGFEGGPDDVENAEIDGRRQLDRAWQLWESGGEPLRGPIATSSRWIDFGRYTVDAAFTGGEGAQRLCVPARGFSFAAGAENGPSNIPGIYEGMTRGSFSLTDAYNRVDRSPLGSAVRGAMGAVALPYQDPCHAEKPVLLPTGQWGWAPTVLQMQVFRIGDLAIVAVPGEPTTMAGRRLRATVAQELAADGVNHVVVAGLANAYSGYVTTREEYAAQHYEGASTEFGPHQLGAFRQEATRLARALRTGSPVSDDRPPQTRSQALTPQRPGVVFDDAPLRQSFGQVLTQPAATYRRGETARAEFRGGHPKNDFRTMRSFLAVQRLDGNQWVDVRTDRDWDTFYTWRREGVAFSRTTVEWRIPDDTPPGTYRLVQTGDWKNGWTGRITGYTGTSNPFTVT
ncbi:MAG: neutral/alkaline non-lysosomal ceramidase N-terminal domain-containing protein [Mobilicoccus sp.]|nr:neutral/alkaline non-lysosomal ceramidase N-terminal domain-containing protein [Mobilicoccus sp.]